VFPDCVQTKLLFAFLHIQIISYTLSLLSSSTTTTTTTTTTAEQPFLGHNLP
jgi:hypothetical protein